MFGIHILSIGAAGRRWARQIGLTAKEFLVVGTVPLNTNIRDLRYLDKLPVVKRRDRQYLRLDPGEINKNCTTM